MEMENNMINYKEHEKISRHSIYNRGALENDNLCGCYYCLAIFSPREIDDWADEDDTALCPRCWVDAVIGESSGYPITREFLQMVNNFAFGIGE